MVTTVQLDDNTKKALVKYAAYLQAKLGRKISFDEAIKTSLDETRGVERARAEFATHYGVLLGEKGLLEDLEIERKRERTILERKARTSR